MVVFTSGKASSRRRQVFKGFDARRKVSVAGQTKPGTLDARFSMLQNLQQQAQKRQTDSRNELLAKKRGISLEQQPSEVMREF